MKTLILVFIGILFQIPVLSQTFPDPSQTLPEWYRVFTFDDKSTVELNTDYVMFSTDKTGRVRFRWTYVNPQDLGSENPLKYQSRISEYEFDCLNNRVRLRNDRLFATDGKLISSEDIDRADEWRGMDYSNTMKKLNGPACKLIAFRKREPASER